MPSPVALLSIDPVSLPPQPSQVPFEVVLMRQLRVIAADVEKGDVTLDALIRDVQRGRQLSNAELLAMQATVSRYSIQLELLSKLVQTAVQGLRDTLRTQV